MSLEKIIKPFKWVDEQVLRQYTKLAKKWEDKGRNIYYLSSTVGMPAKPLIALGGNELFGVPIGVGIEISLYNWDFIYNNRKI